MKHAAIKQRALRLLKRKMAGDGTFSMEYLPDGGLEFRWTNPDDDLKVSQTVADHARNPSR